MNREAASTTTSTMNLKRRREEKKKFPSAAFIQSMATDWSKPVAGVQVAFSGNRFKEELCGDLISLLMLLPTVQLVVQVPGHTSYTFKSRQS